MKILKNLTKSIGVAFLWLLASLLGGSLAIMVASAGKYLLGTDINIVLQFCKKNIYENNQLIFFANALLLSVLFDYKHDDYFDFLPQVEKKRKILSTIIYGLSTCVLISSTFICAIFFTQEVNQMETVLYKNCQEIVFAVSLIICFSTKSLLYFNQHLQTS
jgi:hypothetical protein